MSSHLEPLMEVIKVTDISDKKALIKMKNFLTLNAVDVSSDSIQTSSIGAVSEEILEKLEKVTQAIEAERLLCKPVPPVSILDDGEEVVVVDTTEEEMKTPKKSKKQKRDHSVSSTKEKKKKRVKTEENTC